MWAGTVSHAIQVFARLEFLGLIRGGFGSYFEAILEDPRCLRCVRASAPSGTMKMLELKAAARQRCADPGRRQRKHAEGHAAPTSLYLLACAIESVSVVNHCLQPSNATADGVFARSCRLARWRSVGRPCGQFQGCSRFASCRTRAVIFGASSGVPIIVAERQARMASMTRILGSLQAQPSGVSAMRATSSCTSEGPKTVSFEKGSAVSCRRCVGGALVSTAIRKPFALKTCMCLMASSSSTAVRCSGSGAMSCCVHGWRADGACTRELVRLNARHLYPRKAEIFD